MKLSSVRSGYLALVRRVALGAALGTGASMGVTGCVPHDPGYGNSGEKEKDEAIVGGSSVDITNFPWQVSLQSLNGFPFCGGSILTEDWIVTAAHCVDGDSPSSLRVVAGISRISRSNAEGQIRGVSQIRVFPGFVTPTLGKDIALLRLSSPLNLSGNRASAVPIVTAALAQSGATNAGLNVSVSGWGSLSSGGGSPDQLQAVTIPIVSLAAASNAYNRNLSSDQLAAGVLGVGGRDACQGDSGGPLVVADPSGNGVLLAGVVSWGNGCALANFPGLYARVSQFESWIESIVGPLGTPNQAPLVQINSPSDGATVSGNVTVSALAQDTDGSIASVRFTFPDGSTVNDSTPPYTATWDSTVISDGQGSISAQAFDDGGAASAVDTITVLTSNGINCFNGNVSASGLPVSIPDNNATGIGSNIVVNGGGTINSLEVSFGISHTWRGDLVVTLSAPSGNTVTLHSQTGGNADNLVVSGRALTDFDGEESSGTWTLTVSDRAGADVGTLDNWSLNLSTQCSTGGTGAWAASGTPNLATVDNGQACTSLDVTDSGDASEVMISLSGQHDWRSILRATLSHDGTTAEVFATGTFPREGGSFSLTDQAVAGFSGDASGTWTLCIIDTDAFGDTGTLQSWSINN